MNKNQKYKMQQPIGNRKIFIFIFLIAFILFKPLVQSLQQLSNDDMELCENSGENTEEIENIDVILSDFLTSNVINLSMYNPSFFNSTCIYYSQSFNSNFILKVISPPPEFGEDRL